MGGGLFKCLVDGLRLWLAGVGLGHWFAGGGRGLGPQVLGHGLGSQLVGLGVGLSSVGRVSGLAKPDPNPQTNRKPTLYCVSANILA